MTASGAGQPWVLPAWPWVARAAGLGCLFGAEALWLADLEGALGTAVAAGAATLDGLLAVVLLVLPVRATYAAAVVAGWTGAAVATVARAVGLPEGLEPWTPVTLTGRDLLAVGLGLAAALLLSPLAVDGRWCEAARSGRTRGGSAVVAIAVIACVGALVVPSLVSGAAAGPVPAGHQHS